MKRLCLSAVIGVFLVFMNNGMQGQTTQTKLDQLKLAQLFFVGTWQRDIGKDTTEVAESQQYGNAFIENVYIVVNGKKSLSYAVNYGFSVKTGKFRGFNLYLSGGYETWIGQFTTENKFSADFVQNFNPEIVRRRIEMVFDTPTSMTVSAFNSEGVKVGEAKNNKVK